MIIFELEYVRDGDISTESHIRYEHPLHNEIIILYPISRGGIVNLIGGMFDKPGVFIGEVYAC